MLITSEVLIFALYSTQPQILFPNHIILNNINCNDQNMSDCNPARFNNILGWNTRGKKPYGDGIRESTTNKFSKEPCVAAFGDSFH